MASSKESGAKSFPYRPKLVPHAISGLILGACGARLGVLASHNDDRFIIPSHAYGYNEYTGKYLFEHEDVIVSSGVVSGVFWLLSFVCLAFAFLTSYRALISHFLSPTHLTLSDTAITLPKSIWSSDTVTVEFTTIRTVLGVDMSTQEASGACKISYQPHGTTQKRDVKWVVLHPAWLPPGTMQLVLSAIESRAQAAKFCVGGDWNCLTWDATMR